MPTVPSRARRWIQSGEATPFFRKGVFCIRLNREPSGTQMQEIAVTLDPGSKREGFTVKSEAHTYLNIQATAVTWVSKAVKERKDMRRGRRFRKTPCRKSGSKQYSKKKVLRGRMAPSTRARWGWKLRILRWLSSMYPVTDVGVEDIKAVTKRGKRKWNRSFSPLEVGKSWFYEEIRRSGARLHLYTGYETKELRDGLRLRKSRNKLEESFSAHCVDSWVLAFAIVGGNLEPDNTSILCVEPIQLHRRELHRKKPGKRGVRLSYGSTRSMGFKRGSLIRHPKWGLAYVGGTMDGKISLHHIESGKRLTQTAKPGDCRFLTFNIWKFRRAREIHQNRGEKPEIALPPHCSTSLASRPEFLGVV